MKTEDVFIKCTDGELYLLKSSSDNGEIFVNPHFDGLDGDFTGLETMVVSATFPKRFKRIVWRNKMKSMGFRRV